MGREKDKSRKEERENKKGNGRGGEREREEGREGERERGDGGERERESCHWSVCVTTYRRAYTDFIKAMCGG